MSATWWERVLQLIGFEEVEEALEPVEEQKREELEEVSGGGYAAPRRRRRTSMFSANGESEPAAADAQQEKRGALVSLPGAGNRLRLIVVRPNRFDEVQYIANHLKDRRPVILNLEGIDKDEAQRLVNFLSGATYALDGEMQRIGSNMLLFTPVNVEVSMDEVREEVDGLRP